MSEESADIKSGDQTVDDRDRKGEVVFAKNFSFSRLIVFWSVLVSIFFLSVICYCGLLFCCQHAGNKIG